MINKNILIWRGFETPPTNYHIWFKNGILSMFNGEAWVPIGSGGGVMRVEHVEDLPSDSPVGSFASIVVEGKTQLWVKNDTGWQEYGKESDPEEITNITDIL